MVELAFWASVVALLYVYFGYPAFARMVEKFAPNPVQRERCQPTVTVLIAAHNEAAHIESTIANKLAQDYPVDRLEIIVVSDGSTDGTDEILQRLTSPRVRYFRQEPRNGKTAALNLGARHARGDVLVFADANSMYDPGAVAALVENFGDDRVGYVTGLLRYANPDGTMTGDGCTAYMRYENAIRRSESGAGSIVGVNGGIDAVRRSLYRPMDADDLPDLVLPLRVVEGGYRVVFEPRAVLTEIANTTSADEYQMRVRVSLRALWTLAEFPAMLNPFRHGLFAVQLLSHKVLRYLAFAFMIGSFVGAGVLWNHGSIYRAAFVAQLLGAVVALAGFVDERRGRRRSSLFVPYYFALLNLAAFEAFVKFVRGERYRIWRPRLG